MSEDRANHSTGSSSEEKSPRPQQTQRMRTLDALAGGIARNIGDLLHAVKMDLQMVQEEFSQDHVVQDHLAEASDRLDKTEALAARLLALSKTDTEGEETDVDMVALVKEVLSLAQSSFPTEFTIRTRFDEDCQVVGTPPKLQQLVANLVTQAGAQMRGQEEEQPTVLDVSVRTVTADPNLAKEYLNIDPGTYVLVSVSSTVEGQSRNEREMPGTTTVVREEDSHLSAAYGIVAAHGGEMTVRNELDEGVTYNVYLPSKTDQGEPSPDEDPDSSNASPEHRVLVVDDDKSVRTMENIRLTQFGHEVVAKSDAQEALATVQEAPEAFDVILLDYHMPDMNGLELAHALREEGCTASVALVTGLSAQISEAKARVVGIDHLLRKPVESRDLRDLLSHLGD
jgi:two-component system cell cycle sensor histidine kinase/response regulator CckA